MQLIRNFFLGTVFLTVLALPARAEPPAATLIMKTQLLHDDGLDKDAYAVLVPQGWKMQGAVQWMPTLPTPYVDLSVSNPTDHTAWRQFPRLGYVAGIRRSQEAAFPAQRARIEQQYAEGQMTPNGYEVRDVPATGHDYVTAILAPKLCLEVANAKDVKIVSEDSMPEYAKTLADADPLHREISAFHLRMTYTAPDGPVEREWVVTFCVSKNDAGPLPPTSTWFAEAVTWRAPAGKLDALRPTFAAIGSSVKVQLPWFNEEVQTAQMFLQRARQANDEALKDQREAINKRMEILRDEARQSSQIVSDSIRTNFANQQAAKDQTQRQFMHYVNDTAGYKNPSDGSTLTLDAGYKFQYMSTTGDVIQTNDPTFTPPATPKTSWTTLQRTNN